MLVDFPEIESHAISITAGEAFTAVTNLARSNLVARGQWRVSKIQLIGAIRDVLESRRFKVSKDPATGKPIEFAEVLVRELQNFRERITESANMTYEARQGQHDDLVLATCLPVWLGSQRFCHMRTRAGGDFLRPREAAALAVEGTHEKAIAEAEEEALKRERAAEEARQRELEELRYRPSWAARKYTEEERSRDIFDERWWS